MRHVRAPPSSPRRFPSGTTAVTVVSSISTRPSSFRDAGSASVLGVLAGERGQAGEQPGRQLVLAASGRAGTGRSARPLGLRPSRIAPKRDAARRAGRLGVAGSSYEQHQADTAERRAGDRGDAEDDGEQQQRQAAEEARSRRRRWCRAGRRRARRRGRPCPADGANRPTRNQRMSSPSVPHAAGLSRMAISIRPTTPRRSDEQQQRHQRRRTPPSRRRSRRWLVNDLPRIDSRSAVSVPLKPNANSAWKTILSMIEANASVDSAR